MLDSTTQSYKAELVLVYNADATVYAAAMDFFHKLFSPATYQCNLCRVTYGPVSIKREWKEFLDSLPYRVVFYHRDQFRAAYPEFQQMQFPAIFTRTGDTFTTVLSAPDINRISTVEELKSVLIKKFS